MRKADRLFQIIQILRRSHRPVTSAQLADELEVSQRTIYRDLAHLISQRVPIEGEAGFGYLLDSRFDMPPLMLTPEEIEAVLLGVQMVGKLGDPAITNGAKDVIAKIGSILPNHLVPFMADPAVGLKPIETAHDLTFDSRPTRQAIREGRKIQLDYCAANGEVTHRIIWPVLLGYEDGHCLLIAWCETRQAFRHFRTERILNLQVLEQTVGIARLKLRQQWLRWHENELSRSRPTL
jgi:predicted DNA-binding transcriptional regulator YafY